MLPAGVIPVFWLTERLEAANAILPALSVVIFVLGLLAAAQAWRATGLPQLAREGQRVRAALVGWAGLATAGLVGALVDTQAAALPFSGIMADLLAAAWLGYVARLAEAAGAPGGERLRRLAYAVLGAHVLAQILPLVRLYDRGVPFGVLSSVLGLISVLAGLLPLLAAVLDLRRVGAIEREMPALGEIAAGPEDPWKPR